MTSSDIENMKDPDMINENKYAGLDSPCYLIREADLDYDIKLLKDSLYDNWCDNFATAYSVKTNSLPWLLKNLKSKGFHAEIVSKDEYELVHKLGFKDSGIIYNGPIKDHALFDRILTSGGIVNMDSHEEIGWLRKLCESNSDRTFSIGIRVNVDISSLCPDEKLAAKDGGRFGYCYENGVLADTISQIRQIKGAQITGLHLHSSTQSRTVNVFAALAEMAVRIAKENDLDLSYVDMGGGYFGGRDDMPSYPDYFKGICERLKTFFDPAKVTLIAEPGVSLISRATKFMTKVLDYKDIRGIRYLVTDGSRLNLNPQVTRHEYPHHIDYRPDIPTSQREPVPCQWVCGFSCMEYDRLFELRNAPVLMPGDRIIYDLAGGYTMCLTPLFIRYLPAVYAELTAGTLFKARDEWGLDEFLQKNHY